MYSTPREARSLRFDTANLEVPQPWAVVHRNVEYSGEVIIAETLSPRWLLPLEGGLDFRLVFFTVLRRIGRRPLAKFVELVKVADPSALTGVLDDDVVDFLRRFLKSG